MTENFRLGEIWAETLERFTAQALPIVELKLTECKIEYITARELVDITEESIEDFLNRDPEVGYWHPEIWAEDVMKNFLNSKNYYFDKLLHGKKKSN